MLYELEDEGLNMTASFEHLVGGYESQYYSCLVRNSFKNYFCHKIVSRDFIYILKWSEVYSQDMFESRFNKEGILNPKTGLDYRRCILEPGGSKDASEMVFNFLGREPNEDAFLRSKGVEL